MKKAYLTLQNGISFCGTRFGADGDALGELVFTTGVCGYLETITDPSYSGQIVVQTFPQIGNYGVSREDIEAKPALSAYVVRQWCEAPSNFRSEMDIDEYLKSQGIVALCDVDTREITRIIREGGAQNAVITDEVPENLDALKAYRIEGAIEKVSRVRAEHYPAELPEKHVALIDFGAKRELIRELNKHNMSVTVLPYNAKADEILGMGVDGAVFSGGPGDPADNVECIAQIKALSGKLPMFGICLGHQMLALAMGGETRKMLNGHRGANHPVRETDGERTFITSQNHGYEVIPQTLTGVGRMIFTNANDFTCEGMEYPDINAFSVQFHPESRSGPLDTAFLFERFLKMMGGER